jgi:hypothetical protein
MRYLSSSSSILLIYSPYADYALLLIIPVFVESSPIFLNNSSFCGINIFVVLCW